MTSQTFVRLKKYVLPNFVNYAIKNQKNTSTHHHHHHHKITFLNRGSKCFYLRKKIKQKFKFTVHLLIQINLELKLGIKFYINCFFI